MEAFEGLCIAPAVSPVCKIQPELLQQIAAGLCPRDAAVFSICCRHIYHLMGNQCLKNLASSDKESEESVEFEEPEETTSFLNLLARDLPDQVVLALQKISQSEK